MIKKTLGLLTVLLGFIGVSFGTTYELNSPSVLNNLGSEAIFTFTNGVNFNINSQYFNYMVAGGYNAKYNLFWNGTGLYFVYSYNWGFTDLKQGYIKKFCKTTYNNVCNGSTIGVQWIDIQEFINNNSYTNADYFNSYYSDTEGFGFCFGYDSLNESICFLVNPYNSNNNSQFGGTLGITRNPNLTDLPNDSIKNYFTVSPFSNSSNSNSNIPITGGVDIDGYDYINVHTGNYISYYEDNGFTQDMCYVGTKDLTSLYEDRIVYNQGTGYTIFDIYSKLFNVNSFSVSQIGTFINYWLINYDTWFLGRNRYVDGTPYYNMIYNSPSNYYVDKGPNLTNIFSGNKAVYYFLASTIRDRNAYIDNGSIGEEVALYCYYKLSRYSNVSNDGQNYNINDDHDSSYDSNVAVYVRNKLNGIGSGFSFSGANVINSQSWDGSILDYYTGESYTDFNSFFSSSFNRFKYLFNLQNGDYGLGFIPSYIVIFLMGIILFRFLRH